jgi:ATP-binding cassette subfamily B protein
MEKGQNRIGELFSTSVWLIKECWQIKKAPIIIYSVLSVVGAFMPMWMLTMLKSIVDKIALSVNKGGGLSEVIPSVVMIAGIIFLMQFYQTFINIQREIFYDTYSNDMLKLNMKLSDTLPIRKFDNPEFCNRYSRFHSSLGLTGIFLADLITLAGYIISLIALLVLAAKTTFIFLLTCSFMLVISMYVNVKAARAESKFWKDSSQKEREVNQLMWLGQDRWIAREVRLLKLADFIVPKWKKLKKELREERFEMRLKCRKAFIFVNAVDSIFQCLTVGIGFYLMLQGKITFGFLIMIWQLAEQLSGRVANFSGLAFELFTNYPKVEVCKNMFVDHDFDSKAPWSFESIHNDQEPAVDDSGTETEEPIFQLKKVSFRYNDADVLKDINLEIPKGQVIALCGTNGAGKSTLIKILLGLYSPTSGVAKFQGKPYSEHSRQHILDQIGIAFQDFSTFLLNLRENIGFGDVRKINDDNLIIEAARKGGAEKVLKKAGYNLDITATREFSDEGLELSGGEWQRVAVARAHMSDKEIIIMDEPAAKLDPLAELEQFNNIRQMINGRTAILVSHRIGFARLADRIIVVKNGQIVEDGSHQELMNARGEYANMFAKQAQWYDTNGIKEADEDAV